MRKTICTMSLMSAILWHAGCKHEAILRPPKNPEEYKVPPDDPRYTNAPMLPNQYLNQDSGTKGKESDLNSAGKGSLGAPGRMPGQ